MTLVDNAPEGDAWRHEIKLDGYRTAARIEGGKVCRLTRTGLDWTARFQPIATALASLPVKTAYLDGEVAVLGPDGITSFATLPLAMSLPEAAAGDLNLDLLREWRRGKQRARSLQRR
jgi:bifunctional non-homologous end joining protein LigD